MGTRDRVAYGSFGCMRPAVPLQIAGFILMGVALVIYPCRIREEEAALTAALGKRYRAYCRRTWRRLPGVY